MAFWNSNKSPKVQDEALEQVAQFFVALPEDPTPGSDLIDASKLDFSIESLGVVDEHLEVMRKKDLAGQQLATFVLRCGAYVGEVIRRNSKDKKYHWLDFEEAAKLDKVVASFGKSLASAAVLWDGKAGFTFPFNKVVKYLQNGSEDSVKFFAQVIISNPSKT